MNKEQQFDFAFQAMIDHAETQLESKIQDIAVLKHNEEENKLHTLVMLENGKTLDIIIHVFEVGDQLAVRFYGNFKEK